MADRLRALLAWDGGAYGGWQLQPNTETIQGVVERVLARIMSVDRVPVEAAGRLDAGVHARGQVVSFPLLAPRSPLAVWRGLNGLLPPDISCLALAVAEPGFKPRRSNVGKHYRYRVLARPVACPFRRGGAWHERRPLDVSAMMAAASHLEGRHDFTSFRASGCTAAHPVRGIHTVQVVAVGDEVHIDVHGEAFLRHQVRIMAGTLVEVGLGRRSPDSVAETLAARDRTKAGRTAPAHGLWLEQVKFDPPLRWDHQGGS